MSEVKVMFSRPLIQTTFSPKNGLNVQFNVVFGGTGGGSPSPSTSGTALLDGSPASLDGTPANL
jgi:hypothetical protein